MAGVLPPGAKLPKPEMPAMHRWDTSKKQPFKLTAEDALALAAKALALARGERCRIRGLKAAARYNGRLGEVLGVEEVAKAKHPRDLAR